MDKSKKLADLIVLYIKSRRDKKEEIFYKDKLKKNKQGVVTNGALNSRLLTISKQLTQDLSAIAEIEKSKKSKEQTSLEFQQQKYQQLLSLLPKEVTDKNFLDLQFEKKQFLLDLDVGFSPIEWLNQWTPKAVDISFATHVAKLTHSSSKGSSVLDLTTTVNEKYLTTSSLINPAIDTASSNAASLPIAEFLTISVDGVSVLDCLKSGDSAFFKHITENNALIEQWCENLRQAYDSQNKQSYFLNKQVYFPKSNNKYHLLLPLTSSSMVHALHLKHKDFFEEENVRAREQRKKNLYSPVELRSYPNKAYFHATGSNHSNASALNGQRGGRIALLASMPPPQWQSSEKTLAIKETIFDKTLAYKLKNEIVELQKYLVVIKTKELTISKPERNAAVVRKLREINASFFDYIQASKAHETISGWTIDSTLPIEQALLLEPERKDEKALEVKLERKWLKTLSQGYGRWLHKQLKDKKLSLTKIHTALWSQYFLQDVKEYVAIQEVEL